MINIYLDDPTQYGKKLESMNDAFFSTYFLNRNKEITPDIIRLMEQIDQAKYTGNGFMTSKFSNTNIDLRYLSTGCKTAINAMTFTDRVFNAAEMGDNAWEALLHVADNANIYFSNYVPLLMETAPEKEISVYFDGSSKTYASYDELFEEVYH